MSFLPLVERELRVVSRRKSTFWIRCGAAVICILFLLPALVFASLRGAIGYNGGTAFAVMRWCEALCAVFAGVLLGSDSISLERREGTLGLLFLTNLKNYDVILGKFFGTSLNALYGLLAVTPILGLCVLAGGVTGQDFWQTSLALFNMLFFSIAQSIFVSSRAKNWEQPILLSIGASICFWLIGVGGAFVHETTSLVHYLVLQPLFWIGAVCPSEAFSLAVDSSSASAFWFSLGISHLAGWFFLFLAGWKLDETLISAYRQSRFARKRKKNAKLLNENPIAWLLDDSPAMKGFVWATAGLGLTIALYTTSGGAMSVGLNLVTPDYWLLKLLFAICACRFFTEGRRTGTLELLRTVSLSGKEIISGQWTALSRIFVLPLCLLTVAHIVIGLASSHADDGFAAGLFVVYKVPNFVFDFFAIGWCGMWLSLICRKPSWALWLTILVSMIVPTMLVCIPNFLLDAVLISIANYSVTRRLNAYLVVGGNETRDNRTMVRS